MSVADIEQAILRVDNEIVIETTGKSFRKWLESDKIDQKFGSLADQFRIAAWRSAVQASNYLRFNNPYSPANIKQAQWLRQILRSSYDCNVAGFPEASVIMTKHHTKRF